MEIVLDYEPFEHQLNAHTDQARFITINGGRRAGKSEYAVMSMIRHALTTPNGLSWYLAPTYNDAKEIGWEKAKPHLSTLERVISKRNESELKIVWANGHVTYFKGTDNRKSLRGRGLTHCVMDEAAFHYPDVWSNIVRPALMDRQGSATLITTPNGRNWFYSLFESDPTFVKYLWPTSINPLITQAELDNIKESLSYRDYRQEILAEFVTASGMVYDEFTDDNIIDTYTGAMDDVCLGIDFGFANPSAIVFVTYDKITDMVTAFDEIYVERTPIAKIIEMIREKLLSYNVTRAIIYTDPAGNAEELSSGLSPVDMIRKAGYQVINKGSRIMPGISLVRSYIHNANGNRRLLISKKCHHLIRSLRGYTYPPATAKSELINEEPLKDGINDHMCDALRYFFCNKLDQAKYIAHNLPDQSYTSQMTGYTVIKRCVTCRGTFLSNTPKNQPPHKCNKCLGELDAK